MCEFVSVSTPDGFYDAVSQFLSGREDKDRDASKEIQVYAYDNGLLILVSSERCVFMRVGDDMRSMKIELVDGRCVPRDGTYHLSLGSKKLLQMAKRVLTGDDMKIEFLDGNFVPKVGTHRLSMELGDILQKTKGVFVSMLTYGSKMPEAFADHIKSNRVVAEGSVKICQSIGLGAKDIDFSGCTITNVAGSQLNVYSYKGDELPCYSEAL